MKTRISLIASLVAIACVFTAQSAWAAIAGPYTVDGNTVNLWHMDEATNDPVNAVGSGVAIFPPSQAGAMNQAAFTGFGTSGRINRNCCGNGGSDERGWRTSDAVTATDVLGTDTGAFTIEMLLNLNTPSDNNFTEIFRTESTNFRGRRIDGTSTTGKLEFTVPNFHTFTTSDITMNAGTWYHMAMVYDGNASSSNNVRIYWTEMDDANTSATLVGSFSLAATGDTYTIDHLEFGSDSAGQINGFYDEIRISNIARSDTDMMGFTGAVPEPSSFVLAGLGLVGLGWFGVRRRRK